MQAFKFLRTIAFLIVLALSEARRLSIRATNLVQQPPHVEHQDSTPHRLSPDAYNSLREIFFRYEESKTLGADIILNQKELQANQIIMEVKTKEYEEGLITPHLFAPSQHLFAVLDEIKESPLFKYISSLPKGAVLHAHDTALCSTEYIIKLTYRENLWVCQSNEDQRPVSLLFANAQPSADAENNCSWELLSKVRDSQGADKVDTYLREHLTMYPTMKFVDNNEAWERFMSIFGLLGGLLTYAPVWSDYFYNALEEFRADGVQYLELRTTLPILYDLQGTEHTALDTVDTYKHTLDIFMKEYPDFIGAKLIYAPVRNVDNKTFMEYVDILLKAKEKYPDLIAGFDLVGQEEMGRPLKDFIPQLLSLPDNIDFYFHAGETNWFGSTVDENLIDAILLGTKRIGHGFALVKHPLVLQILKERDIAVEVNPISNQVLQLVSDYRNHPCSYFFADNYPVVISSDDPSFWKATPLSHDFYIAFLGIASAHSDLRLLKKLALNSINYSSMSAEQKVVAIQKWQEHWDSYIDSVLNKNPSNSADQIRLNTNKID
ncbi:adenosine deaminase 2-like [Lucilia sericata]|uniref:adenosine deaminase 2-like n=1 Tax=Lucilia sericata TaxID=13632 RepID=UPI0018A870CB|nr:adenosine deaminase 2-like [Lucilia sericata]